MHPIIVQKKNVYNIICKTWNEESREGSSITHFNSLRCIVGIMSALRCYGIVAKLKIDDSHLLLFLFFFSTFEHDFVIKKINSINGRSRFKDVRIIKRSISSG